MSCEFRVGRDASMCLTSRRASDTLIGNVQCSSQQEAYSEIFKMLIRVNVVQVCDATTAASSNTDDKQNRISLNSGVPNY